MRILLLQLKRIGDLVLTTPALAALRAALPEAHLTLGVADGCAGLLPAIAGIDEAIVFGKGRGWTPWQQVLTGPWDACVDFTGTDRSALAARLSLAPKRVGFSWVREKGLRARAYTRFVESDVRERHTVAHYLDLLAGLGVRGGELLVQLRLPVVPPPDVAPEPYAVLHAGSARAEKFWVPERWAEVARHLAERHDLLPIFTVGPDAAERAHVEAIIASGVPRASISAPPDLCAFARMIADARLVISCDTSAVHLAAAFERPQIALFGPTNPFHWRPQHAKAIVISAAQPDAPMTVFDPRMKGAPMEQISAAVMCRAVDALLAGPA